MQQAKPFRNQAEEANTPKRYIAANMDSYGMLQGMCAEQIHQILREIRNIQPDRMFQPLPYMKNLAGNRKAGCVFSFDEKMLGLGY
jgi:hypothetical protein